MRWLVATQLSLLIVEVAVCYWKWGDVPGAAGPILMILILAEAVAVSCLGVFVSDRLEKMGDDHEPTGR